MCKPNSERWKTSVFLNSPYQKYKKMRGRTPGTNNFPCVYRSVNARKYAFSWIHRPRKQRETPEKHRRTPEYSLFSEFWRFGEHWKTGVFFNSLEFTVPENVRKHSKTLDYSLFSERKRIGKHWKTYVFLNLHEFTVPENLKIRKENACKLRNIGYFPSVNWSVNAWKHTFSWIYMNSPSQKMQEYARKTLANAGI